MNAPFSARAWLCKSISAMPEVPPKLPSIWNGLCVSKRLGSVPRDNRLLRRI